MKDLIYKSFAKLFYYPDDEVVQLLLSGVLTELFNAIGSDNSYFIKIEQWANKFRNKEKLLETLQVEYTRLFINTFPTLPAPLYKSFYDEKELFGSSIGKLIDTYEKYGFEVSEQETELPDNLALLLEFVFRLIQEKFSEEEQISFVEEFILSWTDKLEEKISENAEMDFYKFLIFSLNRFLKEDVKLSKVIIERE